LAKITVRFFRCIFALPVLLVPRRNTNNCWKK